MNRKKVILIIVEGPSDEQALGLALSGVFNKDTVRIEVLHYDITSERFNESSNIVISLNKVVKAFLENNKYIKKSDILRIIHIVDTDGAFIPDNCIEEDDSVGEFVYSESKITALSKQLVLDRNYRKSSNLIRLVSISEINGIPYRVYYMSCNLDVVLYGKYNSTDEEKEQDAYRFATRFKDNVEDFIRFMTTSEFSTKGDYRETWRFIQKGCNSLQRYSNLHLCFYDGLEHD